MWSSLFNTTPSNLSVSGARSDTSCPQLARRNPLSIVVKDVDKAASGAQHQDLRRPRQLALRWFVDVASDFPSSAIHYEPYLLLELRRGHKRGLFRVNSASDYVAQGTPIPGNDLDIVHE